MIVAPELLIAFAAAAAALICIPGPTVLMVMGHTATSGARVGYASLIGVALGDAAAIAISAVGFGAVLAASAEMFLILKWAGAAYLVYLGVRLWRAPPPSLEVPPAAARADMREAILQAFTVTLLNPKGIIFFAAFMPQFIDPARPTLPQTLVLGATFVVLAVVIQAIYVTLLGRARRSIASPSALRWINRVGASFLIGAGVMTAALKRSG